MAVAVVALGAAVLIAAGGGIGKVAAAIGSTFDGLVTDLTRTPEPSPTELVAADAPFLAAPDEPYTNEASIDLVGTVPRAVVGADDMRIRIYVAIGKGDPGIVREIPVGPTAAFTAAAITLSPGTNAFTATIVGPSDLESEPSAAVVYILDKAKPKITITSPKPNATINARSVKITGQTQGRSSLSAKNLGTNATVTGEADGKGVFSITVPIGTGTNQIAITATDPAGNASSTTITVRHGTGKLVANVNASFYQVRLSSLPEQVRLSAVVTDPDGRALPGANVTFTLAVPGVPAIASSVLSTGADGKVSFTTTIPKGATVGQCSVTAIVQTAAYGDTTDRTSINVVR
jgi:Glucodextranase, domain B